MHKKWHNAEHVAVEFDRDSQWLVHANIPVVNPLFSSGV
jgi:hypothetical protein